MSVGGIILISSPVGEIPFDERYSSCGDCFRVDPVHLLPAAYRGPGLGLALIYDAVSLYVVLRLRFEVRFCYCHGHAGCLGSIAGAEANPLESDHHIAHRFLGMDVLDDKLCHVPGSGGR